MARQFRQMGKTYQEPRLVLFSNQVESACGFASAAVGPFYCPGDGKVYLDLSFFDQLQRQFRAPGEFAQAYVIAHEIGHHVQNLLGISERVSAMRGRVSPAQYNQLSVRLELQADFLAGLWAHHAQRSRQILEAGDVESGTARRQRHRRRPTAAREPGPRRARLVHARHLRAACALVSPRAGVGPLQRRRHVQHG